MISFPLCSNACNSTGENDVLSARFWHAVLKSCCVKLFSLCLMVMVFSGRLRLGHLLVMILQVLPFEVRVFGHT